MSHRESLIADNIGYLQQALELLRGLNDDLYDKAVPLAFGSGLGAHVRHCLEHYESFLAGWRLGQIDYDARPRDGRAERERAYAMSRIEAVIAALHQLEEHDEKRAVRVRQDCNAAPEAPAAWSDSTVRRELQFLVSHTVHHYALIAMMLRLHGAAPHEDFGVAPSTLKYRKASGS
jgi:uncharacterized damage-inducible protein DinB